MKPIRKIRSTCESRVSNAVKQEKKGTVSEYEEQEKEERNL